MDPVPVLALCPGDPDPETLGRAARLLTEGEVVAGPSDTVYGFLALPRSDRARSTLSRLKGRPGPWIVLVRTWEEARGWTRDVPAAVWERLRRVWPGPVTVLLPVPEGMPGSVDGTIALRMPDSVFLTRLLAAVGEPLFSTSANPPGEPAPLDASGVVAAFDRGVALVLDAGAAAAGPASTIVDLARTPPRIVREGRGDATALLDPLPPDS